MTTFNEWKRRILFVTLMLVAVFCLWGCGSGSNTQCKAAGDCSGDPGELCEWVCTAEHVCEKSCRECDSADDCTGDPGSLCEWVCTAEHACEKSCRECDSADDCTGDPGTGCEWICTNEHRCDRNCTTIGCETERGGMCVEDACPAGYHVDDGSPMCGANSDVPCCPEIDRPLCCIPGNPIYCEDQASPHVCVEMGTPCPAPYGDVCLNCVCRDLPGGVCCVAIAPCTITDDCTAEGECCVDFGPPAGKQCTVCPGLCDEHDGACTQGPGCFVGIEVTDGECEGECCEDPDKPVCCNFVGCNTRHDCLWDDICCVDHSCIGCEFIECESKEDCGNDDDVCCVDGRCSVECS